MLALWDAGYHEIIPVVPPFATIASGSSLGRASLGKIPGRRGQHGDWYGFGGWQKAEVTRADVEKWIEDGASFGMRTRYFATLDVDVVNPKLAEDIERIIARTLGRTPKRVGRAPKFAMPFRAEQPFSKMRLLLSDEDDKKSLGVIEVLCNGQQFVVHGTHPATGGMYTWYDGARTGGVEVLAACAGHITCPDGRRDHDSPPARA